MATGRTDEPVCRMSENTDHVELIYKN